MSGAKAYVDTYNNTTGVLRYHQTETTGFASFLAGETVTEVDGSGTGTLDSAQVADIDFTSGEILYIENRAAIARATDQTEDIKIVIQL